MKFLKVLKVMSSEVLSARERDDTHNFLEIPITHIFLEILRRTLIGWYLIHHVRTLCAHRMTQAARSSRWVGLVGPCVR